MVPSLRWGQSRMGIEFAAFVAVIDGNYEDGRRGWTLNRAGESVRRMRYTALDKSQNVDHIVGPFRRIGVLPGRFGTHNGAPGWP